MEGAQRRILVGAAARWRSGEEFPCVARGRGKKTRPVRILILLAVLLQQLVVAEALQSGRTTVAQGHGEAERRGRCWISAGTAARV